MSIDFTNVEISMQVYKYKILINYVFTLQSFNHYLTDNY